MAEITMDDKVRDIVTDFEGIVVARVVYRNGCVQFCVKPKVSKDGKLPEGEYIDEDQLEVVSSGIATESVPKKRPGGEYMPDCPKH